MWETKSHVVTVELDPSVDNAEGESSLDRQHWWCSIGTTTSEQRLRVELADDMDEVSAACRFYIDSGGRVGIGTSSPNLANMLHVAGRVRATGCDTGDIKFANDYTLTEDEEDGVAFLDPKGQKIAVLDMEGNFHIKGKVMEDLWPLLFFLLFLAH